MVTVMDADVLQACIHCGQTQCYALVCREFAIALCAATQAGSYTVLQFTLSCAMYKLASQLFQLTINCGAPYCTVTGGIQERGPPIDWQRVGIIAEVHRSAIQA